MKTFLNTLLILLLMSSITFATKIEKDASVAVMDFGTHPGAVPIDINIFNAGQTAHEYILKRLFESGKVNVVDRFLVEEKIREENLNTSGLIDPDTALKLGKILGVKYIIYGNVNDISVSEVGTQLGIGGVNVCTVKSHIIARIMNVETGDIISASKGEGKSKSSFVKVKGGEVLVIEVGRTKVTQDSVHNAIQKAANQTVDVLIQRLYLD